MSAKNRPKILDQRTPTEISDDPFSPNFQKCGPAGPQVRLTEMIQSALESTDRCASNTVPNAEIQRLGTDLAAFEKSELPNDCK